MVWKSLVLCFFFLSSANAIEASRQIALRSGYGRLTSQLSGAGFNADLPNRYSTVYGVDLAYRDPEAEFNYEFGYDRTSVDLVAPDALTPSAITAFREETTILATIAPWANDEKDGVRLKFGLSSVRFGGTETAPNEMLTTQEAVGVLVGASHTWSFAEKGSFTPEALLFLPFSVRESNQVTGYSPTSVGLNVRLLVEYEFFKDIAGFVGLEDRVERTEFKGSVSRGVTDGTDLRSFLSIPIGVRFGF